MIQNSSMAITTASSSSSSSVSSAFTVQVLPDTRPQVFINFRGVELRNNFISYLERGLKENNIRYYLDKNEIRSYPINIVLQRVRDSKIALAIFSKRYAESKWCLDELVEIMKKENNIRVIPVFFKVSPGDVKGPKNDFAAKLYQNGRRDIPEMPHWEDALASVPMGLKLEENGVEDDFLQKIIAAVKEVVALVISESGGGGESNMNSTNISALTSTGTMSSSSMTEIRMALPNSAFEQRLKELEERLDFDSEETQIVGIVGMSGIGKTVLADMHFQKWENRNFLVNEIRQEIHKNSMNQQVQWLKNTLLKGQELSPQADIFKKRSFLVLDDVSDEQQVGFLIENLNWIKKGSKIVIAARNKSSIERLVQDIYIVPGLNDKEALELFKYHAFRNQVSTTENLIQLSKKFVDYAGGNPRALEELGKELCGKCDRDWDDRLKTLTYCCNENLRAGLKISYDVLDDDQKQTFLDIACFFRSEEEDYVRSLLDSACREAIKDLVYRMMISISAGRIEMHNLLSTLGNELSSSLSDDNKSGERMTDHEKITIFLRSEHSVESSVRGIFLDMSKLEKGLPLDPKTFTKMPKLRYLKIFNSSCARQCEGDNKVNLPEGLEFPLQEIRYFHWLKLTLKELPADFKTENLVDLRLPYSEIERLWEGTKELPNLKWVDLSHSTNLIDISALSKAESLQRLSLEGCTVFDNLPGEMKNMQSLAFLNLRGCKSLVSLPFPMNLISLKTLILSDCSNFKEFQVISVNLESLHLDGTAINGLPPTIESLQRLVLMNLKNCKMLDSLPESLYKLKALEELILSGCSMLKSFPQVKEIMKNLQILLLDGTSIKEVPHMILHCSNSYINQVPLQRLPQTNDISLLRRLCLSRNDLISSLQSSISHLYHLKWIDLKYCKNLTTLSTLPPNLQCLDAHGCISLKSVASPLARLSPTDQAPSSFIFTNCEKLEHAAKKEIICYGHTKSRVLSDALNRHNKGLAFEALVATCFPGNEVPGWFIHKASGALLEPKLPRHWNESGFVGIALCAIVLFKDYNIQNSDLMVKCICKFNNAGTSSSSFNCQVGGLSEAGDEERAIKSTHVFIGYTNWLNINKIQEEEKEVKNGQKKPCVPTLASIEFEVTDGIGEVTNNEVIKCGFSLVYESCSLEESSVLIPRTEDSKQDESRLLGILRRIRCSLRL